MIYYERAAEMEKEKGMKVRRTYLREERMWQCGGGGGGGNGGGYMI